jgi:hypothetical protein
MEIVMNEFSFYSKESVHGFKSSTPFHTEGKMFDSVYHRAMYKHYESLLNTDALKEKIDIKNGDACLRQLHNLGNEKDYEKLKALYLLKISKIDIDKEFEKSIAGSRVACYVVALLEKYMVSKELLIDLLTDDLRYIFIGSDRLLEFYNVEDIAKHILISLYEGTKSIQYYEDDLKIGYNTNGIYLYYFRKALVHFIYSYFKMDIKEAQDRQIIRGHNIDTVIISFVKSKYEEIRDRMPDVFAINQIFNMMSKNTAMQFENRNAFYRKAI